MSISNLNSILAATYLNPLSSISNISQYGRIGNIYQTGLSFQNILRSQQANQMKQEQSAMELSVKKCTLAYDEEGDMIATLEIDSDKQYKTSQSAKLAYQRFLMQQAAFMPYGMNMYSGYNSLYGLTGINNFNFGGFE